MNNFIFTYLFDSEHFIAKSQKEREKEGEVHRLKILLKLILVDDHPLFGSLKGQEKIQTEDFN